MNASTSIRHVSVIGAGQMGSGIAQVCASAGLNVALCDVDEGRAAVARARIAVALEKLSRKGKIDADAATSALGRIHASNLSQGLAQTDLAIEAINEDPELKCRVFAELDALLPAGALLASNTSSISISRLAACTKRAGQVIGMHFMNPVPLMQLVEVVTGEHTSAQTLASIRSLAEDVLGKTVIVSKDRPGFIVNRLLLPLLNEACLALQEGLATAEDIDAGARLGLRHPMGPLELADFIGLDTVLAIAGVLQDGLHSDKYAAPQLLRELVHQGHLGRKSGRGFYTYAAAPESPAQP